MMQTCVIIQVHISEQFPAGINSNFYQFERECQVNFLFFYSEVKASNLPLIKFEQGLEICMSDRLQVKATPVIDTVACSTRGCDYEY